MSGVHGGGAGLHARQPHPLQAVPDKLVEHRPPALDVIEGGFDRATRWARLLGSTLLVTFVVGLVGVLVVHARIIENQSALDAQRREIDRIGAETESMRHDLAELEAPARVVVEAYRMGMIEAPEITYLKILGGLLEDRTISVVEHQLLSG